MKQPIRWHWAALMALSVFVLLNLFMQLLILGGRPGGRANGPLWNAYKALADTLEAMLGEQARDVIMTFCWGAPVFLGALFVYCRLRPRARPDDGYLRCLKCGYILKGLSEPRCPECGEWI